MITKDSIESAYSFFHQKWRVYEHSSMEWQKDDIEYAIAEYVSGMSKELYALLSHGDNTYLTDHTTFAQDIKDAIGKLEGLL